MPSRFQINILSLCAAFVSLTLWSQPSSAQPKREQFQNADVSYGWAQDSAGHKLRTFVTRPRNAAAKVPAIFFVGWLSCDSVEYPMGETDPFGAILRRLIDQSGYATMRMDKPGVGESEGDCAKADYQSELSGYQAAFEQLLKYDFIDPARIVVIGLSNGGGTAPLAAGRHPVRGYVAASSWGRTWYEHMVELERVRLTMDGKSPADINAAMKVFPSFYNLYLNEGRTPGEILANHPDWKSAWYDAPDGQYGRPAAFYQQLQALNLGQVWQEVSVPVLVLHGSADNIMSHADSQAIADSVNRAHSGNATYMEISGGDHALSVGGKLDEKVVPTILEWLRGVMK
jgi:pimeloyl-ACP methyl ester carboxylesterase